MRLALVFALVCQLFAPAAEARSRSASRPAPKPTLEAGARVRITLLARPREPVIATLLALPPGKIDYEDSLARSVDRLDVKKIEISRGIRSRAGTGAQIGFVALGVPSAIAGVNTAKDLGGDEVATGVVLGILGGLIGAGMGALIGGGFEDERWTKVETP